MPGKISFILYYTPNQSCYTKSNGDRTAAAAQSARRVCTSEGDFGGPVHPGLYPKGTVPRGNSSPTRKLTFQPYHKYNIGFYHSIGMVVQETVFRVRNSCHWIQESPQSPQPLYSFRTAMISSPSISPVSRKPNEWYSRRAAVFSGS